jgi:predicted AlkP superfamily phosphohydrolase/phosphomutase
VNAGGSVDTSDRKTVVFGLDGACFELIEPWLDAGALPTLAGLIDAGGQTALESCVPATTPPAWTSLTTGVNPGKHGVFGFYGRRRGSYDTDPVSDVDVRARRLWDYTTEADLTSLVVNVPVTHPPREIEGALVPGYLSPDPPSTYPDGLLADLGLEEYRVYADSEAADVPEAQLRDEWLALTDSRRELTLALMERYEWDLLFVEFQKTDGAVHKFDDEANIRRVFERVDDCMAAVLDAADGDPNVFVVSDHGIGQPKQWAVALNTWLVEAGYATTTTTQETEQAWTDTAMGDGTTDSQPQTDTDRSATERATAGLVAGLGRLGVTKQRLERALSRLGVYERVAALAPAGAGSSLKREIIDEASSRAFYQGMGFSGVDVGVTINDDYYYDDGIVTAEAYDDLRSELIERLEEVTGPDGQHAFSQVQPREAVYDGDHTREAPDIVLEQSEDYVIGSSQPRGQTFIPTDEGRIDHTRNGILIAAGPDIDPEWTPPTPPSIVDVTPTVLHLLDLPLNEEFDGGPLTSLLSSDRKPRFESYEPYRPGPSVDQSAAERKRVEDRLRGMGYLE